MTPRKDAAPEGDYLKYYCIVFGVLVAVITYVAIDYKGRLGDFEDGNRRAHALLMAEGATSDGRPRAITDLGVEVEKFVQGYAAAIGGSETGGTAEGISKTKINEAGLPAMQYITAGQEQDDPNRSKGYRTRYMEFDYGPSSLENLAKLVWNIENLGRYRVFEIHWTLADTRSGNDQPPFNMTTKPRITVGYRTPLSSRER